MENNELNLLAMQDFLIHEIRIADLLDELNRIYNSFMLACMRLSDVDAISVDRQDIESAKYLKSLIEVFKLIQNENADR